METTHEMLRMGEKNSHNQKQLWGWHEARTMNLQENGPRFKRNSSLVFTCWERWWEPPWQLLRHSLMKIGKVEPTMKRIWKILEKDIWLMITHSYVKLGKESENNSGKELEESGKILEKDLWVRAHWKGTPLKWLLEKEIAPVELNGLNEVTTSK